VERFSPSRPKEKPSWQGFSPLPRIETFFAAFFLTLLPLFQLLKGKNAGLNWGNALEHAVICPACQP
jgi:hypothetical protein